MKRKAMKLLSMILTAAMVLSCSIMIAFAEETPEVKLPELKSAQTDSITLVTEDGYEYAIRTKDDTDADIWKWADEKQYNKEEKTVTFNELTANTEYTFARRTAGTEKVADGDIQKYSTLAAEAESQSETTTESEAKPKNESKTESETKTPNESKTESETKTEDESKAESETKTPNESKAESEAKTEDESKAESETKTPNESKAESETKTPDESKAESESKTESETPAESEKPNETEPTKKPEKAPTPGKLVLVSFTDKEIVVSLAANADKAFGYEFTLDGKTFTAEPSFKDLQPDTDYEIRVRIKADVYNGKEYMESDLSEALKVHTMKAAAPAPKVPVLESRTETSLKVKAEANQEYALKGSDSWQTSGEFNNLQANTAYEIVTRTIYDANTAMESLVSEPLKAKTIIGFSWHIGGIEDGRTYDAGTSFKVDASAAGLDNTSPSVGDTRYKPLRWNWGGNDNGYFKDDAYKTDFRITDAGNYRLNIVFGLETYTDKGWVSENREETASVSFKIVAKEFTIKATSTTGGKLSPTGTFTVIQAKNYTITMTPDKNYKLAKVLVDGKEVAVKDLKYTFENVNSDHTIHAVFEKAGKLDAPKTGDSTPVVTIIVIFAVSLIAVIACAVLVIKRRNTKK